MRKIGICFWFVFIATYVFAELPTGSGVVPADSGQTKNQLSEAGARAKAQYEKQLVEAKQLVERTPNDAESHYRLGKVYYTLDSYTQGYMDKAIAEYKKAIELEPDYWQAHYSLGWAYKQQGKNDEANAMWAKSKKVKPPPIEYAPPGRIDHEQRELLKNEKIVYKKGTSLYLMNGLGKEVVKVLGPVSPSYVEKPSLSPDRSKIVYTVGAYKVYLLSIKDRSETLIFDSLRTDVVKLSEKSAQGRDVASPIWSQDGREIFFFVAHHLLAYSIDKKKTRKVSELPVGYVIGTRMRDEYMRLSKDGQKIFALVCGPWDNPTTRHHSFIWQIDLSTGQAQKLWGEGPGKALFHFQENDEAFAALFGSREFPVLASGFSRNRRFYFYYKWREGFLAKYWIEGYDTLNKRPFIVKIIRRALYAE